MTEAEDLLRRLGAGSGQVLPIAEAALAFAALARPGLELTFYRAHLSVLARAAAAMGASTPAERAAALSAVLSQQYGYRGDIATYDDLANADLTRVIDRRRGLPVTLGILYLTVARSQGWTASGLNFPGHFLVGLGSGTERIILDPFDRGAVCDRARLQTLLAAVEGETTKLHPDHCRPVDDRDVVLRLQNNIKMRLTRAGETEQAVDILDRMLLIAPDYADLWSEQAQLNATLGRLTAARAAAEQAITHADGEGERARYAALLRRFKSQLN